MKAPDVASEQETDDEEEECQEVLARKRNARLKIMIQEQELFKLRKDYKEPLGIPLHHRRTSIRKDYKEKVYQLLLFCTLDKGDDIIYIGHGGNNLVEPSDEAWKFGA